MRLAVVLMLALAACASKPAPRPASEALDWPTLAAEPTVVVVTKDPDGRERATTIWLVVVDGVGTIRTGSTRWFANLQRDPALRPRARGIEYPLRIDLVADPAEGARIDAAFRAKYGFSDRLVSLLRTRGNRMKLLPRQALGSRP
jgi:hypothetical protein